MWQQEQFQSTLPQGKWPQQTHGLPQLRYFNPHFRKGSDACHNQSLFLFHPISIHTSAREVTNFLMDFKHWHRFQSTLPQGKWRRTNTKNQGGGNFNPHFRKGSDDKGGAVMVVGTDFNPHFRKGSDCIWYFTIHWSIYFNPHFRKGSDYYFAIYFRLP